MYFVASVQEGVLLKTAAGQTMGTFNHVHEDEVREMAKVLNSRQDITTFCEQVVFWHENFAYEQGSDIQKTTSKILLTLAKDVLDRTNPKEG